MADRAGVLLLLGTVAVGLGAIIWGRRQAEVPAGMVLVRNKFTGQTTYVFKEDLDAYLEGDWELA